MELHNHRMQEVAFKYSIIPTEICRPQNNKRLFDEMLSTCSVKAAAPPPQPQPLQPQTPQDGNPRPVKRRKAEVEDVGAEPECDTNEEETSTRENLERTIKGLDEILGSCHKLSSKAAVMEDRLVSYQQGQYIPIVDLIKSHINVLASRLQEQKSFCSLWVGSSRPAKNVNLGFYGLLPVELIYSIFRFVGGKELMLLSQVCTLFHEIAQDESLWKALAERLWPISISLGQKPDNRTWRWLFKAKMRRFKPDEVRDGVGFFVLPYGNLYEGEWGNGKRHGQGTGIMKDGRRYDGQWENDMRYGFGIFRWPLDCGANGGDTYVGEWKDSKRHGHGVYTWVDGTKYDGQWGDGKREGMGCVVWPDGRRYVGEYKDGKMEGTGTFTWPDESVYVGDYVNGKRHGKGRYTYSNGGIYEGEWEGGMRHGKGTLWKSTGEKYEGQWRWNAPYGLGTVTYKDGRQVEKQWIEDELLITP